MIYLLILALFLSTPAFASNLDRVSYFKDSNRNRVMVYNSAPELSPQTIQEAAEGAMHTPGQFTIIFVFPDKKTEDKQFGTQQPSYEAAINVMYIPAAKGWRYYLATPPPV